MQIRADVLAQWLPCWAGRLGCASGELAALCGVDKTTMSRWWTGKRGTDATLFAEVANRLWQRGALLIPGEVFAVWRASGHDWRTALADLVQQDPAHLRPFVNWLRAAEEQRVEPLRQGVRRTRSFVERSALLESARVALLGSAGQVVLYGTAGAGKTTLAAALATDPSVGGEFWDGVLWATLEPDGRPEEVLRAWHGLLRLAEAPEKDALRLARQIAEHLAQPGRRYLVVLDDLWSEEPLAILPEIARPHALLITTRDRQLIAAWPDSRPVHVPPMSEVEALTLLDRAGCSLPRDAASEIARLVEGQPLALSLVATLVRLRGQAAVLAHLRAADVRLAALQLSPVTDRSRSVRLALDLSYNALPPTEQVLFRHLGAFPAGADFAVPPVAALCPLLPDESPAVLQFAEVSGVLAGLADRGLLERLNDGEEPARWRLHALVHDYARWQLKRHGEWEAVRAVFVGYYVGLACELGVYPDIYGAQLAAEWSNLRGAFEHAWESAAYDLCALLMMQLHSWLLLTGRFGELRAWLARLADVEAALSPVAGGWFHHASTRLALARRDREEALRQCALVLADEAVENRLKAFLCLEFVGPALEQNDPAAAITFLAEGRRWAGDLNDGDIAIAVGKAAARLALAQGDWPAAAGQIALTGFAAHEHHRPLEVVEALRLQAALLWELGASDEALGALEAAWRALQAQGAPTLEWNALLDLLPLAAANGDETLVHRLGKRLRELEQRKARRAERDGFVSCA